MLVLAVVVCAYFASSGLAWVLFKRGVITYNTYQKAYAPIQSPLLTKYTTFCGGPLVIIEYPGWPSGWETNFIEIESIR
jgi:hypothetical protein